MRNYKDNKKFRTVVLLRIYRESRMYEQPFVADEVLFHCHIRQEPVKHCMCEH